MAHDIAFQEDKAETTASDSFSLQPHLLSTST